MNNVVEIMEGVWVNPDSVESVKAKGTGSVVQFRDTNREVTIPGKTPERVAALLVPVNVDVFAVMSEKDLEPELVPTVVATSEGRAIVVTVNYPCYGRDRKTVLAAFRDSIEERIANLS